MVDSILNELEEKNEQKEKHKYIFPNFLAEAMNKCSQRTQYEATMMSIAMILLGLICTAIYSIVYFKFSTTFKIMLGSNAFFAFLFLSSSLVTTYQQYRTYMEAIEPQYKTEDFKIEENNKEIQLNLGEKEED